MQGDHPAVKFNFFSGDSADVIEKLDKGLLDFGVLIDRTDLSEYVTMRLPACDVWGVLVRRDSPLARHESVSAEQLRSAPLIVSRQSRRKGSQLCEWFGGDMGHLNIRAEYNLIYNATLLVRAGMGCAVTIDKLINTSDSDLCFRPLYPKLETRLDMAWEKTRGLFPPRADFSGIYAARSRVRRGAGIGESFSILSPVLYTIPTRMRDDDTDGGKESAASCA